MLVYGYRAGINHVTGTQHCESYHGQLKDLIIREQSQKVHARRLDWLLHALLHTVAPHYMRQQVQRVQGALLALLCYRLRAAASIVH